MLSPHDPSHGSNPQAVSPSIHTYTTADTEDHASIS